MEQVISSYVAALDELNPLTATSYYTADGDETERAKKVADDLFSFHVRNESPGRLVTLAESEFHRVYNQAVENGGQEFARRGNPNVTKTWYTVRDEKVRETHDYLEGVSVRIGEDFYTFDGDHAAYPGGFLKVENNANCRCIVLLSNESVM